MGTRIYEKNIAQDFAKVHNGDVLGNVIHNDKHYKTYVLQARRSILTDPKERIGAIACVLGLQSLISEIQAKLHQLEGPHSALSELLGDVKRSKSALDQLHSLFKSNNRSDDFSTLISCRQALTSSTNAVRVFDDLYTALSEINSDESSATYTGLLSFGEKLRWQTKVWHLQIRILQSSTLEEAERSSRELRRSIEQRISVDLDLERRIDSIDGGISQIIGEIDDTMIEFQRRSLSELSEVSTTAGHRMSLSFEDFLTALDVSEAYSTNDLLSTIRICCVLAVELLPSARRQLVVCSTRVNPVRDAESYRMYEVAVNKCDTVMATQKTSYTSLLDTLDDSYDNRLLRLKEMADTFASHWTAFARQLLLIASAGMSIGSLKTQLKPLHAAIKTMAQAGLRCPRPHSHFSATSPIPAENSAHRSWSSTSEITLADSAVMSVMSLPIHVSELRHGSFYATALGDASGQDRDATAEDGSVTAASVLDPTSAMGSPVSATLVSHNVDSEESSEDHTGEATANTSASNESLEIVSNHMQSLSTSPRGFSTLDRNMKSPKASRRGKPHPHFRPAHIPQAFQSILERSDDGNEPWTSSIDVPLDEMELIRVKRGKKPEAPRDSIAEIAPHDQEAPRTQPATLHDDAVYVRALYDYHSDEQCQLSFRQGDILQVVTQLECGWWDGVLHGTRGWFPSNYFALVASDEPVTEVPSDAEQVQDSDVPDDSLFWIPQANAEGRIFYLNTLTGKSTSELSDIMRKD